MTRRRAGSLSEEQIGNLQALERELDVTLIAFDGG